MNPAKLLGIFGIYPQIPPFFGAGDGDGVFENFGDASGMGKPQISGILWGKIPENLRISGRGGGKNLGDFPTTTLNIQSILEILKSCTGPYWLK